ncbi:MAG: pyridoxamine 5'-phosphate oxidase [Legionellales bacterium]|jgi:pyridoxamine 5'-phosphate oxidase
MDLSKQLQDLRREYQQAKLDLSLNKDPIAQCQLWIEQAITAQMPDATAMVLATANKKAEPSVRVVLLKGFEDRQLIFFSHYESHKGHDMTENPQVAVNFFWPQLERQIIIQGTVSLLSAADSDTYFQTRPRASQIATIASHQSQPIDSREFLLKKQDVIAAQFKDKPIPRPENWGGYAISPHYIEFWQGRESRLHDRIAYYKDQNNWTTKRLSP